MALAYVTIGVGLAAAFCGGVWFGRRSAFAEVSQLYAAAIQRANDDQNERAARERSRATASVN